MKLEINGKFIIISILVLVGLFFLLWHGCGGNNAAVAKANVLTDSAIKANAQKDLEIAALKKDRERLKQDSIQAAINQEALAEEANKSEAIAGDAQDATKVYQKKYEDARKQVNDLLALSTCDSLNVAITNERTKGNKALKACKDELNGCGDIVVNRNKMIYNLNQQVKALQQPANIVSEALHSVKAATKEPWVKVYLGAGLIGNQGSIIHGWGPDGYFQFRGGTMGRGGAKFMGNGVFYEIGVAKLISFKKR
jgi:hypothetical protein